MDYKKIVRDNYTIHIINSNRFKAIDISINFSRRFNKKTIKLYSPMLKNLMYSSKKYNSKDKIAKRGDELYGMSVDSSFDVIGNIERFSVNCYFLNPIYTDEKYFKESIDFYFEILLNPNVKDNKFDSKYFNIVKDEIRNIIISEKDYPKNFAKKQFNKIMYKGYPNGYSNLLTLKELDELNEKEVYEFYKELFSGEYKIDVIIEGKIDSLNLDYIENKLKHFKGNNKKLNIIPKEKEFKNFIEKEQKLKFNQSVLYMGYKVNGLSLYEKKFVMKVYNTILGTMNNSILFKTVREDNSLCYSISSYYSRYTDSLVVYSGINKTNYEKTIKLINECVNMMSDINVINYNINAAKKTINTVLNGYYDDVWTQINEKYYNEFESDDDIETKREIFNKVKAEDIVRMNDYIKHSVIYFMKGDN